MRPVVISGPLPAQAGESIGGVAIHTERLSEELSTAGRLVGVLDDSRAYGQTSATTTGVRGARAAQICALSLAHPLLATGTVARSVLARNRAAAGIPLRTAITRSLLVATGCRRFANPVLHIQQADYRPLYADWAGITAPRVITVHGMGTLRLATAPASLARIIRANLSNSVAIAVPSRALKAEVIALGVAAERLHVIPNGVDHAVFFPRDYRECRGQLEVDPCIPLAVYVGRLTHDKGVGDLLRAWRLVRVAVPDAHLALVGPAKEPLDTDMPGVLTPGSVDPHGAARWLGAANVAVVPSRYEGFGLSALEAMVCARPVVATNVGGLPEVVTPGSGALVSPENPGILAEALIRLLTDPEAAQLAGSTGARAASSYSWVATGKAYGDLYDSL